MGDEEQARAAGGDELEEQRHHRVAGRLVEVAGRLVGEDEAGPGGERAADRHPLLLAAGELLGVAGQEVGEAEAAR